MPRTRTRSPERPPAAELDWPALINEALTAPGSLNGAYSRFYQYSFLNQMFLLYQGCPLEPIATYNRWSDMGRQVKKGSKAFEIVRPIQIKLRDELDDEGQPKKITKFKPVKCIFPVSMTEGEELPPYEPPEWSEERALAALAINRVAFQEFDGNTAGYSHDRDVAINPVAPYPFKTLIHEIGHITLGHCAGDYGEYQKHRGRFEFQAEGTAYLVMNELAVPEGTWNPGESRAYVQTWLQGEKPSDADIRQVFSATDVILKAGRSEELVTSDNP